MIVLKIIGWVLLGILALILFALAVRVRFDIEYSDENTGVVLRWLFLKFRLYPMEKKPKKPAAEKEEAPAEEAPAEEKPAEEKPAAKKDNILVTFYNAEGFDGVLTLIKRLCSYLKTFVGNLLYGFVVDEFYLEMGCTKADAAATAVYYGEVCAAVFPMLASLASRCRLKKYDINIYPDYIARFSRASFVLRFHFVPLYLIHITLVFGVKTLFGVLLRLLRPKKVKAEPKPEPVKASPAKAESAAAAGD